MALKHVEPALGEPSFSCPHCGALADQRWLQVLYSFRDRDKPPTVITQEFVQSVRNTHLDENEKHLVDYFEKAASKVPFLGKEESWCKNVVNLHMSLCHSCRALAIWRADTLLWPAAKYEIAPNDDLPADIRMDFEEAGSIVDRSPRGAAALLRLAIQKLVAHLLEKPDLRDVNAGIGELVVRGLPVRIQKALDIVRVIGNNAVHPGQIDLRDDKATAVKLFGLVNLIADSMITQPNQIEGLFEQLPQGALEGIAKRDKPKDG